MSIAKMIVPGADFSALNVAPATAMLNLATVGPLLARFSAKELSTLTLDGTAVTSWSDTVGGVTVDDQGLVSARPTFEAEGWTANVNGAQVAMPCLDFDGAIGGNTLLGTGLDTGPNCTMFMVVERAATQNDGTETPTRVLMRANSNAANIYRQIRISSAASDAEQEQVSLVGNSWSDQPLRYDFTPGAAILSAESLPNSAALGVNGSDMTQVAIDAPAGSVPAGDELMIGGLDGEAGLSGDAKFAGKIAEVLIFSDALSQADRQAVEGHLAWEWGLVANLPDTHPYSNTPPGS